MNTQRALILALAAGLLAPAIPAQAAEDVIVIARADAADFSYGKENRRARRTDEGERGYGYGYERRQGGERADDMSARDRGDARVWRPVRNEHRDRKDRDDRPSRSERR